MSFKRKTGEIGTQVICHKCDADNFIPDNAFGETVKKPSLLLHSCCGPCSTAVVERLTDEFDVTLFFYNPCITDEKEYSRRREAQNSFIVQFNSENSGNIKIYFKEGPYRPKTFLNLTEGFEDEPEGGKRCILCFEQRLEKTAETAKLSGYEYFGTTLTVSPHKNFTLISEMGKRLAIKYGITFIDRDFKKRDGFRRSIELSKKYNLYRQNYCGCKYSKRLGDD